MPESLHYESDGDCLWVTPRTSHVDLDPEQNASLLHEELAEDRPPRVIVDLSQLPYFGSTVLELLVRLWRKVSKKGGQMVIYKPSAIGREVLCSARFNRLWPLVDSRDEAVRLAKQPDHAEAKPAS